MRAEIIDRGRGPEIAGTRITVDDVVDYWQDGRHHTALAALFGLTSEQILAAFRYIEAHSDELQIRQQKARERIARGNPPAVKAKRDAARAKIQALLEPKSAAARTGEDHAGPDCR